MEKQDKAFLEFAERCHSHAANSGVDMGRALTYLKELIGDDAKANMYWDLIAMGMPLSEMANIGNTTPKTYKEFSPLKEKPINEGNLKDLISQYVVNFDSMLAQGNSILLCGDNSLGKTYSALMIMRLVFRMGRYNGKNYRVFYTTFADLYDLRNKEYSDDNEFWKSIINCDLLVVDELGKENKVNDAIVVFLEKLLKHRTHNLKPTILVTNLMPMVLNGRTAPNILDHYGKSVYEILTEKYRFLLLTPRDNKNMRKNDSAWGF